LEPELTGDLELVDAETGARLEVSTSEEAIRRYRAALHGFVTDAARRSARAGLDYLLVEAGEGAEERALDGLARREVVR
jgi:hypothetical protein